MGSASGRFWAPKMRPGLQPQDRRVEYGGPNPAVLARPEIVGRKVGRAGRIPRNRGPIWPPKVGPIWGRFWGPGADPTLGGQIRPLLRGIRPARPASRPTISGRARTAGFGIPNSSQSSAEKLLHKIS